MKPEQKPDSLNSDPSRCRRVREPVGDIDAYMRREFPHIASLPEDHVSRRVFLHWLGASLALAGLTGCGGYPREQIVPYVRPPLNVIPGEPSFYATAMNSGGYALGLLVKSREGRPTKIEGNPRHPASLGSTGWMEQAAILNLYDPDRSQVVRRAGEIAAWNDFGSALQEAMPSQSGSRAGRFRILTETIGSPTLADQLFKLLQQFPGARWHQYEPLARDNALAGALLSFGAPVETRYHLEKADVIVSLDADFLVSGPGWVRHARDFIDRRRIRRGTSQMNRLYVVESTPTNTGAMADDRMLVPPAQVELYARMLLSGTPDNPWLNGAAADLQKNRGRSLVIAGDPQPPAVHALAHALNEKFGNVGATVEYTDPVPANPVNEMQSLHELVADMNAGQVDILVILGGNPAYNAPADFRFADAMQKVPFCVHLSLFEDETSLYSLWHLPESHFLEAWSDGRAFDGTASIVQPLIAPLYDTRSSHEVLAMLSGQAAPGYQIVRRYWASHGLADDPAWQAALRDGVIPGTALAAKQLAAAKSPATPSPIQTGSGMQLVFRPDPIMQDGRFANNSWLQELPKPLTRISWDNVAYVSPRTAEQHGISSSEMADLRYRGGSVRAPVFIMPGQPDNVVTVHLGYGRKRAGKIGTGVGYDAYLLRTSDAPWFGSGLEFRRTGEPYRLASFQLEQNLHARDVVRPGTFREFLRNPGFSGEDNPKYSLFPNIPYKRYKWGMVIDNTACIGCGTCVLACQAENNIPVVGKDQVARGRAMYWIRIDCYFQSGPNRPDTYFEPVPCMQCETAPCELVCPVDATVHSDEGLNQMVYNRCVGTRYCSNNCPYKVRRFNFYQFADYTTETLKPMRNPEVTVRSRGVMEKCTYCIQRIQAAKISAQIHGTRVRDGEVTPACAQACPTAAIVFGDLNDPNSRVTALRSQPHNFGLLMELNTRPRTTYLPRILNPGTQT